MRFDEIKEKLSREEGWWIAVAANAIVTVAEVYDLFYIWSVFSGRAAMLGTALVAIVIWTGYTVGKMLASDNNWVRGVAKVSIIFLLAVNALNLGNWYSRINDIDAGREIGKEYDRRLEEYRGSRGEADGRYREAARFYQQCIDAWPPRRCNDRPDPNDARFAATVPYPGPRPAGEAARTEQAKEKIISFNLILFGVSVVSLIFLIIVGSRAKVRPIEVEEVEKKSRDKTSSLPDQVGEMSRVSPEKPAVEVSPTDSFSNSAEPEKPLEKPEKTKAKILQLQVSPIFLPDEPAPEKPRDQKFLQTLERIEFGEVPEEKRSWVLCQGKYRLTAKTVKNTPGFELKDLTGTFGKENDYLGWFNQSDGEAVLAADEATQERLLGKKAWDTIHKREAKKQGRK